MLTCIMTVLVLVTATAADAADAADARELQRAEAELVEAARRDVKASEARLSREAAGASIFNPRGMRAG